MSLFAEQNDLMFAVPGGLIGVGTKVGATYLSPTVVFDVMIEIEDWFDFLFTIVHFHIFQCAG